MIRMTLGRSAAIADDELMARMISAMSERSTVMRESVP